MKARYIRRLEALEDVVNRHATTPLRVVDVLQFPDEDREAYWGGDDSVLLRYMAAAPESAPGVIHTIIITVNDECRAAWEATRHLTEDELEVWDEAHIREEDRTTRTPVEYKEPEIRFDKWGYRISD